MTITDQIKILNKKIMQNEVQYDLDRKAAKISALSFNNLDKYEYLTAEDLGLNPSTVELARFECSPVGKIFNKGLHEDDKKEGLFKSLKNIENTQKGLINGNNKPDSARSKLSKPNIFDSISSKSKDEDEDENQKTARELYQDGIESINGLKLPGDIEIKDEKSQMYLENNLNKIKNNIPDIYDNYQRFFECIANKEKDNIDYEKLSYKVNDINFYDRYNTLYNYLNYFFKFSVKEIFMKNKSFLKDLSKGFKLKNVYTTKAENNIEKAYDDLVFNDKKIDDVIYKKIKNEISDINKDIFQEAKVLFDLRVEIYKKLVLEEENLKFEKSVGETVKLKNQKIICLKRLNRKDVLNILRINQKL